MTDAIEPDQTESPAAEREPRTGPAGWVIRIVFALVLLVVVIIAWKIAASAAPRVWAHYIGRHTDGKLHLGAGWGLAIGFVFTLIPLLLIFQIRRSFLNWTARLILLIVGLALALPNWLTLDVVLSNSSAAHAADRTLDVDAPWFRGGSVIGAVAGAALALVFLGAGLWMAHRKRQVHHLRDKLDDNERRLADHKQALEDHHQQHHAD